MTIDEIKRDMSRKLANATNKTYQDGVRIIEDSFDTFYAQGNPKRRRTGTLRDAAYNPEPSISATSSNIEIGYEGDKIGYSDGTFTGGEVLGATMTGTYGVLGDPIYDELAFEDILEAADKNFASEFK
ncbi:hypothetical protein [[Ruminococcus] torques]|uniref:hypothetical protein n=1 Tax=[Ruminococcus] torques TaxID=33039 RepID=UPI00402AB5A1